MFDEKARLFDLLVLSATFESSPGQPVTLAEHQSPVRDSDVYHGEPGFSSVQYEGEIALSKPFVDVIVNGSAYAPGGQPTRSLEVTLRVGDIHKKLMVTGDRGKRALRMGAGRPEPFERMPIVYERAFGGTKRRADPRNPIGVGYKGAASADPRVMTRVPNIEYAKRSRSGPAGLGIVGRNWVPRSGFAGTYDDAWLAGQCPLLPLDFDSRHHQAAPVDQQSSTLKGGEEVVIQNMTPGGTWSFSLPTLSVPVRLRHRDRVGEAALKLDTVLIEPDEYRLTMIARTSIPVVRNRAPLEEIVLGHVSPAWWRARVREKIHLDWRGLDGRLPGVEHFRT
ncbi:MAG: DUF2169 family type VI secretion system accessory protein [Planctomycetota bacterium]